MIAISGGMHAFVLFPIVDLFKSKSTTYIEFEMREVKKTYHRSIPRPRRRYNPPIINDTKAVNVQHRQTQFTPIKPIKNQIPKDFHQKINAPSVPGTPDIPDIGNLQVANWTPVAATESYFTKKDYFDMVRMRIESNKKYPSRARFRNIEGHVKVSFEIITKGMVQSVKVEKSSGKNILDNAAIDAVKNSSPFPLPPPSLFKLPLKLVIVIVFELT